jgi:hypothetical protein
MLIQRRAHGRWEGWFAKVPLQIISPTSHEFCTSPLPPSISLPLDQHHVAPIEVSIVCTDGLVSTWYVPHCKSLIWSGQKLIQMCSSLHLNLDRKLHYQYEFYVHLLESLARVINIHWLVRKLCEMYWFIDVTFWSFWCSTPSCLVFFTTGKLDRLSRISVKIG